MPKVAIIILNYNCWKDTIETVQSVIKNDYSNFEVFVVDNCSTDDSWQKLNQWYTTFGSFNLKLKSSFFLVQNPVNNGFAGGNNFGIKIATKKRVDYFLILNPDVEVEKNFLSEMVKFYENSLKSRTLNLSKRKIGFVGPRIFYHHNRNLIYSNGGKINWSFTKGKLIDNGENFKNIDSETPFAVKNQKDFRYKGFKEMPFETDYVSGTALLIHKNVLNDIGLMDESFFLYYEDTEWALRASKKGYKHFIVPSSIIYHKESVSTGKFSYNYVYYHTRNALMMAKKHGNIFIKIYLFFFIIQKITKQFFKLIFFPSKKLWAKAILKGIWDYLINHKGKI